MQAKQQPVSSEKERAEALASMNLTKIVRAYVQQAMDDVAGYKGLLLDKETMRVCSTMFGRSEFADNSVVCIERIDQNSGKNHQELKAIVFVRPTRENVTQIKKELRKPRFQGYHLIFTNLLAPMHLQDLAEADVVKELIASVSESYADFVVIDPHHFLVPTPRNDLLIAPRAGPSGQAEYEMVDRFVQGLSALFLALRRRPVIRYQRGSDMAQRVADSLYNLTYKQQVQVFDFGARSTPLVLLLDRRDDPVTPLLSQWTYQAMVHELIGIHDNTLALDAAKVSEEQREVVLDAASDEFYRRHMYANYGDIGASVKAMVEAFQAKSAQHTQVSSLEEMKRFIAEHSDFQRTQGSVSKHVNLMAQLSDVVSRRQLMEVSMAEQELANPAATLTAATSFEEVLRLLRNPGVQDADKVRLVMLFALRFESDRERLLQLVSYLQTDGLRGRQPRLFGAIEAVLQYGGNDKRAGDLYGSRNIILKTRNMLKGLQGVENVYTQHTPLLSETLAQAQANRLPPAAYPYMAASQAEVATWQGLFARGPPREVIVFVIGGTTYEEAKAVAEWNDKNGGTTRVILGGSGVLNSREFLAALTASAADAAAAADDVAVDIR